MVIDLTSYGETRGLNESEMIEYLQDIKEISANFPYIAINQNETSMIN